MTASPPTRPASREPRGEAPEVRLEREILRLEGVSAVKRLQRAVERRAKKLAPTIDFPLPAPKKAKKKAKAKAKKRG